MEFIDCQNLIAAYLKQPVSTFSQNGENLLAYAINQARHRAELAHDFYLAQTVAQLSVAATGSNISGAVPVGGGTAILVKRVRHVLLVLNDADLLPIEFMTNEQLWERIRRQVGRQAWNPASTLASLGVSTVNPVAYQDGPNIFLYPASSFTFPITVQLDVIQFMPDYVNPSDEDFFLQNCADYLQWQSIVDGNRYWKELVPRQEGNIEESSAVEAAATAFAAMLQWDIDIRKSTSTPEMPPPQPTKGR